MVQLKTTGESVLTYSFEEKSFTWSLLPTPTLSPVTISVPHNGIHRNDLLGLFPKRKQGICGTDYFVWPLVKGIAWHFPINTLRGMLPRFIVDYNRYASKKSFRSYAGKLFEDTEEACEEKVIINYHRAYHQKLISTVLKSKKQYGPKALFFDFHGFSKQPPYGNFDLILGTANRHILKSDIDHRFAEFFTKRKYNVFLPSHKTLPTTAAETDWYSAGFTTRNVFLKTGVDSIQVEVASDIRKDTDHAKEFSSYMGDFLKTIL